MDAVAARDQLRRIVDKIRSDGHDAFLFGTQGESPTDAVKDSDGVVAVVDHCNADTAAAIAFSNAHNKPALALATAGGPRLVAELATLKTGDSEEAWFEALPAFYEAVRPFAGRVVRDRIPQLVKEAGHHVAFREVQDDEKSRFLKQKVANEARELLHADLGKEKEEIADVLEALEALIRSRNFERDDLRRVKEAKRKRRGGFDRVYVVESTAQPAVAEPKVPAEA